MKNLTRFLLIAGIAATLALPALARAMDSSLIAQQQQQQPAAQEPDQAQRDMYSRFVEAVNQNTPAAHQNAYNIGREYLQRYGNVENQYVAYVRTFVANYERASRVSQLETALNEAATAARANNQAEAATKYNQAFALARQMMTGDQPNLRLMVNMAWSGLNALSSRVTLDQGALNDANNYARRALQMIEGGTELDNNWAPFGNRADTIGWLNYALAVMNYRTRPVEAMTFLRRAAETDSSAKRDPAIYNLMGGMFEADYAQRREAYQRQCANQEANPQCEAMLNQINQVIDRIVDSYARAIAYANASQNAARYQPQVAQWRETVTNFYRFRHEGSTEGLDAFITGSTTRALPEPVATTTATATPPAATPAQPAQTTPGTGTPQQQTTPATTPAQQRPAQQPANPPATTPPANRPNTPATTNQPATRRPRS